MVSPVTGWMMARESTSSPNSSMRRAISSDAGQTSILCELIGCYLARLPDQLADQQARLVAREFDRLSFLWAGSAERGKPHYYRIQGERVFIEYDNTQRGANHIHTVWRDLANDFGGDALARHYAQARH